MPKNIFSSEYERDCAELAIVHGYKHKDAATARHYSQTKRINTRKIRTQELEKQVKQLKSDNQLLKKR